MILSKDMKEAIFVLVWSNMCHLWIKTSLKFLLPDIISTFVNMSPQGHEGALPKFNNYQNYFTTGVSMVQADLDGIQ